MNVLSQTFNFLPDKFPFSLSFRQRISLFKIEFRFHIVDIFIKFSKQHKVKMVILHFKLLLNKAAEEPKVDSQSGNSDEAE